MKKRVLKIVASCLVLALTFGTIFSGLSGASFFALFAASSPPTLQWENLGPSSRTFGSVHDFGVFVFGYMTGSHNLEPVEVHMEGGVAVRGNLDLYNARGDFGGAHAWVNEQMPNLEPRLVVGGNINSRQVLPYQDYMMMLHGGDLLVSPQSAVTGQKPISTTIDRLNALANFERWPDEHGAFGEYGTPGWADPPGQLYPQPLIPIAAHGNIETFFQNARTDLVNLSNNFRDLGNPLLHESDNVWVVEVLDYIGVVPPVEAAPNDIIVVNLVPDASGVVTSPRIDFLGFDGGFIFNVDNTAPVFIRGDTYVHPQMPDLLNEDPNHPYLAVGQPMIGTAIHHDGRVYSHRIIWNFTGSGAITHEEFITIGTILAPHADFKAIAGGAVKGLLIVNNFYHHGEGFEQHTPNQYSRTGWGWGPIDVTPPTEPTTPPETTEPTTPPETTEPTTPPETTEPTTPPETTEPTTPPETTTPPPTSPPPTDPPTTIPPTDPPTTIPPTSPPTDPPTTPTPTTIPPTDPPTTIPTTDPPTDPPTTIPPTDPPTTIPPTEPPVTPPVAELPTESPIVTVDLGGGEALPLPEDVFIDGAIVRIPDAPVREGYFFVGWELGGVIITAEMLPIPIFETQVLTATWISPRENPQTYAFGPNTPLILAAAFAVAGVVSAAGLIVVRKRYLARKRAYGRYLARKERLEDLGIFNEGY